MSCFFSLLRNPFYIGNVTLYNVIVVRYNGIAIFNPDLAVGCKICPKGQALWPDSDRKRHEPTKALLGALSGERR
jgi:hypothetical protein